MIEDKTKWIQKECFDFFSEPYPDIKKINKIEEKIVKSNVNLLNTKSNKYSNILGQEATVTTFLINLLISK